MCHFYFLLLYVFCFTAKWLCLLSQTRYSKSRMLWMKSDCQPIALWKDPNSQLQCLIALCNSPDQRLKSRWFNKQSRAELPNFQLLLFIILLASAFIGTNDERSPRNSSSRDFNRNRDQTGRISLVSKSSSSCVHSSLRPCQTWETGQLRS